MQPSTLIKSMLKRKKLPEIRPGDTVRVFERIKEGEKTRTAIFEGVVIARRHGSEPGATITVRRISYGIGVERIFPLYTPTVEKFEITRRAKVRRAKLNYLRYRIGRQATIRGELMPPESGAEETQETLAEEPAVVGSEVGVVEKKKQKKQEAKKEE